MTDLSQTQALDDMRAIIASKTAAYEAEFGPVQTLPIYVGDRPSPAFVIVPSGRPKAEKPSRALRAQDHKRVLLRTTKKMEKVRRIAELALTGMRIEDIAEQAGFTPPLTAKYVQLAILEHGLSRGRVAE